MNKIYTGLLLILTTFFTISCSDDDHEPRIATEGTPPQLVDVPNNESFVLEKDNAEEVLRTYTWEEVSWGMQLPVTYYLEIAKAGTNFEKVAEVGKSTTPTLAVTVLALNTAMTALELPLEANNMEMRVAAQISSSQASAVQTLYSDAVKLTVTPYDMSIIYPKLYIPGDHNSWGFTNFLYSAKFNTKYEGYVYLNGSFKFTSVAGWGGTNYGDGGAGILSTDGGAGNLSVASGAGLYYLTADTDALTWTNTPTTWSIIGTATPGGWDANTLMTFDPTSKVLTVTEDLKAGVFKFRRDNNWDVNLGSGSRPGLLAPNGGEIAIEETGTYTITLDYSDQPYYYYTITKE